MNHTNSTPEVGALYRANRSINWTNVYEIVNGEGEWGATGNYPEGTTFVIKKAPDFEFEDQEEFDLFVAPLTDQDLFIPIDEYCFQSLDEL